MTAQELDLARVRRTMARQLRARGFRLRIIAASLGVSTSCVFAYCKGIEKPKRLTLEG